MLNLDWPKDKTNDLDWLRNRLEDFEEQKKLILEDLQNDRPFTNVSLLKQILSEVEGEIKRISMALNAT